MLVVDTFRFFRTGKGFVVTVGVINPFAVFVIFSTLGVPVVCSSLIHMEVFLFVDLSCFFISMAAPAAPANASPIDTFF